MSSPYAEGGPLPPADPERLAAHEKRLDEWRREIAEEREDEVLQRLRDGIEEL